MLETAIMIEGQNGLNWERWQRIVSAVEDLGFGGLYRSDHFTNASPPDLDSLELWVSLTWLAANTRRIEFGPLVTPLSFRHPVITARQASAVDDLSNGRLTLGLGAGWQEREHTHYGFDLLRPRPRFRRFEEGLQIVTALLRSDQPVSFAGEYFRVQDAILLPRPKRPGGPPILIGGSGPKLTLPLAAKYASEWNGTFMPPAKFAELNRRLDDLLAANGRAPTSLRRSTMTGCVFGRDDAEVQRKIAARGQTRERLRERGIMVGTAPEAVEQLGALAQAGCERVMLQWLDLDDMDGLEALARDVLPQIS
ncbi:MAG: TIGR03560 family F420-dependent LLM class oxidoreductase [Chloroflexi bacterium]|nr:TIGR03560 family F420-dependent LLM class oxidoreductase [Chloroflexota bacterium]